MTESGGRGRALQEQTFFTDPALDRLMGIVFRLAAELHVTRDQVQVMAHLLEEHGVLQPGEIDRFTPTPAQADAAGRDRQAYVEYVLSPVLGRQASLSEED